MDYRSRKTRSSGLLKSEGEPSRDSELTRLRLTLQDALDQADALKLATVGIFISHALDATSGHTGDDNPPERDAPGQ